MKTRWAQSNASVRKRTGQSIGVNIYGHATGLKEIVQKIDSNK